MFVEMYYEYGGYEGVQDAQYEMGCWLVFLAQHLVKPGVPFTQPYPSRRTYPVYSVTTPADLIWLWIVRWKTHGPL